MSCKHPSLFQNMCVVCGMKFPQTAPQTNSNAAQSGANQPNSWKMALNVSGGKVLQLSAEEAASVTASKVTNLKNAKKLALVLDLDHTLLHAVQIEGPTPSRTSATARVIEGTVGVGSGNGSEDNIVHHLPIEEFDRMTVKHLVMKKRPFLDEFLERCSEFCQMTVYTAGTRRYAEAVARVIDPSRRYFADRIVARCDVANIRADGNDKSLERIYPGDASMAVIIDDREDVWRGVQGQQLLMVKPFVHFDPRPSEASGSGKIGDNASTPLPDALGTLGRGAGNTASNAVLSPVITLCSSPSGEPAGRIAKVAPLYSFEHSSLDDQLQRCLQVLLEIHAQFYASGTSGTSITSVDGGTSVGGNSSGSDSSSVNNNSASVESKSDNTNNTTNNPNLNRTTNTTTNHTLTNTTLTTTNTTLTTTNNTTQSVSTILRSIKRKVLHGCTLTFSGLIPTNEENPRNHSLWRLAEALGAQVSLELLPRTTHLISVHIQTLKVTAVLTKRANTVWVLHPDWLVYCRWSLSRASENTFMLNQLAPGQAYPTPVMDYTVLESSGSSGSNGSGVRKESLVDLTSGNSVGNGNSIDYSTINNNNNKRSREDGSTNINSNNTTSTTNSNSASTSNHTTSASNSSTASVVEDNSMLSALKRLRAVGPSTSTSSNNTTSGSSNGSVSGSSGTSGGMIRANGSFPNGTLPPMPTPITNNTSTSTSTANTTVTSATSRSQLFAHTATSTNTSTNNTSTNTTTTNNTTNSTNSTTNNSTSTSSMQPIKKKVVAYLEDSLRLTTHKTNNTSVAGTANTSSITSAGNTNTTTSTSTTANSTSTTTNTSTNSTMNTTTVHDAYFVPYDAGGDAYDYFSTDANYTTNTGNTSNASTSTSRNTNTGNNSNTTANTNHTSTSVNDAILIHNDNDVLSGSEDGEVVVKSSGVGSSKSSSDRGVSGSSRGKGGSRNLGGTSRGSGNDGVGSGYSSDSSDNSLASHSNRTHSTHSTHRYSGGSGRDSVEGDYYLGSDDEEEEIGDEGMLCCNDDQGSTCSATGSGYIDDYGAGEGSEGSEGSDYGGSSSGYGDSSGGRDGGNGSEKYANGHSNSNSHTYSSSSTHNTTHTNHTMHSNTTLSRAARRSDSNSSVTNSSDDEGSDFEDMMNRRRLSIGYDSTSGTSTGGSSTGGSNGSDRSGTSSASGNNGTIVETEDDEGYYAHSD